MKPHLGVRRWLAGLFLILSMGLTVSRAQQNVGAVVGVVRDPSGAVVPNASLTVRSLATGVATEVKSNAEGAYAFPSVPIGEYTLTIRAAGFKTLERPAVRIVSSVTITLDVTLEVGLVSQSVEVTGLAPKVDSTTTTTGTTRVTQEINELPLLIQGANRSVVSFLRTFPGVSPLISSNDDSTYSVGIANTSINGAPEGGESYAMDGVFAANSGNGGLRDDFSPPPEMIEEMRLNATNSSEYGWNSGVGVTVVTKSGTNQLHGDVFEYLRNEAVDARNFLATKVSPNKQNEYGFTLGGPLVLPKVYDGKDKTFFFIMWSGYRYRTTPSGVVLTVPTDAMRQGNFSEWLGPRIGTDALGRPIYQGEIYDPTTTRPDGQGGFIRDPYSYNGQLNVIPSSALSSISSFFQNGFPHANLPGTQLNWVGSQVQTSENTDKGFARIDHNFANGRQRITYEYDRRDRSNVTGGNWGSSPISTTWDFTNIAWRMRLIYTATLGSSKVLSFRMGANRFINDILANPAGATGATQAGLTRTFSGTTPGANISLLGSFGNPFAGTYHQPETILPVNADFSWAVATHNLKFGAAYLINTMGAGNCVNCAGHFGFSNFETGLPGYTGTGLGFASFLTGWVDNSYVSTGQHTQPQSQAYGFYAQDSWRVTSKLTLNYGLRLDRFINIRELNNEIGYFDPTIPNPGAGGIPGAISFFGTGPGRNGMHNIGPAANAWSPRFGFAYSVTPKTVFRAAYGLASSAVFGLAANGGNLPATGWSWAGSVSSADRGVTPVFNWTQTKGFPLSPPPLPDLDPAILNGGSPQTWYPNDIRPARTQNINAGIERELRGDILLSVNYVGTLSHGLLSQSAIQANQLSPQYVSLGNLLLQNVNSPAAQAAGIKVPYAGFNGPVSQALVPFPQYQSIPNIASHTGYSEYNALQVTAQKRFGQGLFFLLGYTNSKQLTNVGSFQGQGYSISQGLAPTNAQINTKFLGQLDRPQNLSLSWVYQLPFGPGKRFANTTNPIVKQLVGGWQVAGLQQYTSGDYIAVSNEQSIPGYFGGVWTNRVTGVPIVQTGCGSYDPNDPAQNRHLNNSAFVDPAPFTFGNTRVLPNVRNCPYFNENFSAQKIFSLSERARVLFSADFTNIFNRHTWLGLQTDIDNKATFGRYTGASDPRLVQFHLRLEF